MWKWEDTAGMQKATQHLAQRKDRQRAPGAGKGWWLGQTGGGWARWRVWVARM